MHKWQFPVNVTLNSLNKWSEQSQVQKAFEKPPQIKNLSKNLQNNGYELGSIFEIWKYVVKSVKMAKIPTLCPILSLHRKQNFIPEVPAKNLKSNMTFVWKLFPSGLVLMCTSEMLIKMKKLWRAKNCLPKNWTIFILSICVQNVKLSKVIQEKY